MDLDEASSWRDEVEKELRCSVSDWLVCESEAFSNAACVSLEGRFCRFLDVALKTGTKSYGNKGSPEVSPKSVQERRKASLIWKY